MPRIRYWVFIDHTVCHPLGGLGCAGRQLHLLLVLLQQLAWEGGCTLKFLLVLLFSDKQCKLIDIDYSRLKMYKNIPPHSSSRNSPSPTTTATTRRTKRNHNHNQNIQKHNPTQPLLTPKRTTCPPLIRHQQYYHSFPSVGVWWVDTPLPIFSVLSLGIEERW